LDCLTAGGLRIIRLRRVGSDLNLLAETPNNHWPTPHGEYHLLGGHRLWAAPEIPGQTYIPDAKEVLVEEVDNGLRLTAPVEAPTGLQKSIQVSLHPSQPALTLTHSIANHGTTPVELAAWAITALPLGGTVVLPQTAGAMDSFQPNRNLALWSYTRINDPRLRLGDDFIRLQASPSLPPCKIGYFNTHGWVGYLRDDVLFVKRFQVQADQPHADRGCNVEVYCNDQLIELETLSPLIVLQSGGSVIHVEIWELHPLDDLPDEFGFVESLNHRDTHDQYNHFPERLPLGCSHCILPN
jgi:hypothetical protein